jgi:membrane-associated phospholipid phosphatase
VNLQNRLADRLKHFKLFEKSLLIFWSILTILIVLFQSNIDKAGLHIIFHLGLITGLIIVIPWLDQKKEKYWLFSRYWYLILGLPLLYWDMGNYVHLVTPLEFDPLILAFEEYLFGVIPNVWIQDYINPYLTEVMQISYSIYWITIPLGAAIFYSEKRLDLFEYLLYYVTIAFFISYLIFIFFPVCGPRFFIAEQITVEYEGFVFTDLLRGFIKQAGYRGGAFPSSHVGVAVTILVILWYFKVRIAKYLFLPLVVALSLATVYGQYHYVTDVAAGLIMGLCIGIWGAQQMRKKCL